MLYPINPNELFHVHTYRCNHAGTEPDSAYIEKAIDLGARKITFTDHAPFPGDFFDYRMRMDQLPEYLDTLTQLKEKYQNHITVSIGLEIEYLPSFHDYYLKLKAMDQLDFLMIGQHLFEDQEEAIGFTNAIVTGIETGLFSYVAHPDRSFRRRKVWTPDLEILSARILAAATKHQIPLEKNASSMRHEGQYWKEFWNYIEKASGSNRVPIVLGLDAHCTDDLELKWE